MTPRAASCVDASDPSSVGPVLGGAVTGANHLLQQLLHGSMRAVPDIAVPFVDVRDVATAHVAAVSAPAAAGQRVLLSAQESAVPLREVAALLRAELGERGSRVSTRSVPSVVVRAAALLRPELRGPAAELGHVERVSTARARDLLGSSPRPWQAAVLAGARSLLDGRS